MQTVIDRQMSSSCTALALTWLWLCFCTNAVNVLGPSTVKKKRLFSPWYIHFCHLLFTRSIWQKKFLWTPAAVDCQKRQRWSGCFISFLLISFTKLLVFCDAVCCPAVMLQTEWLSDFLTASSHEDCAPQTSSKQGSILKCCSNTVCLHRFSQKSERKCHVLWPEGLGV